MKTQAKGLLTILSQLNSEFFTWKKGFSKPDFDERFIDLLDLQKEFSNKLKRFDQAEQSLSIGIMGQVKAGKSSFLNAVLFDGHPVLPEAATPKTANLTRITYGEKPLLTITYYTQDEWKELTQTAAIGNESTEGKVARELMDMVKKNGLNINAILSKGEEKIEAGNEEELRSKLNDYVGESGKFTALVKMTEIALPRPELKGYDVVDTPGMNDPVVSREIKTKEYMAQCDVVFFLSRCGQFLDQKDADLLSNLLPAKGVKRMYLIAVQMDGVILDDGHDRKNLSEAEINIRTRLSTRAISEIGKCIETQTKLGHSEMSKLLETLNKPIFASSYAHGISSWPPERWEKQKSIVLAYNNMNEMAKDAWGSQPLTQEDWTRIGNFVEVDKAFEMARADKAKLIDQQRESVLPEAQKNLEVWLRDLQGAVSSRSDTLKKLDLADLELKQKQCQNRLEKIVSELNREISGEQVNAKNALEKIIIRLRSSDRKVKDFRVRTGTEENSVYSHTEKVGKWYNPFSWGETENRYRYETCEYQYVSRADAIEQVMLYGKDQASGIQREFDNVVSVDILRTNLQKVLLQQLEAGDKDFDPGHFRDTFTHVIGKLKLPTLRLEYNGAIDTLNQQFSSELRDAADRENLRQATKIAKQVVHDDLLKECNDKVKTLCQALEATCTQMAQEMPAKLHQEMKQLRVAFSGKERELTQYGALLDIIRRQKTTV
jgi:hypothetical protein